MAHKANLIIYSGYVVSLLLYGSNALRTSHSANLHVLSNDCGREADLGCIPGAPTTPNSQLIQALSRDLNNLRERGEQSSKQCQTNVMKPRFVDMGLGAASSAWVKVFLIALQLNATVVTPDVLFPHFKAKKHGCAHNSLSCLIKPFSNCDAPGLRNEMKLNEKGEQQTTPWTEFTTIKLLQHSIDGTEPLMPQSFAGIGVFWFTSTVVDHVLQPSDDLANQISRFKEDMGFLSKLDQPVLAVHMRRGDSCKLRARKPSLPGNPRTCHGPEKYFEAAQDMRHRHGFKSMYVATDDQDALESLRSLAEGAGWKVMALPFSMVPSRTWGQECNKTGQIFDDLFKYIDGYSEISSSLLDVHLMAAAEGFVGRFDGNLGNVAYALMAARAQVLPPRRVLEGANWCLDYLAGC